MTVTYAGQVASSTTFSLLKLLLRWRGSIYKFVWKDFAIFAFLHFVISFVYHTLFNEDQKRWFEHVAKYCHEYSSLIPIAFIVGFYVAIVVGRFWEQLNSLPWPNRLAVYVSTMIHGRDKDGRLLRRNIMRYLTVAYVLTMRDICPPVRKRFPKIRDITRAGLISEEEQKLLKVISQRDRTYSIHEEDYRTIPEPEDSNNQQNVYYVPLVWAADLINRAYTEKRIKSEIAQNTLIEEINNYRGMCGNLFNFDWITVPLVYTQVVTIAVYTFFLACLFGRQALDQFDGDLHFPLFTFLEFIFYMGLLKVAENLLNPFGGDDVDFEINPLIEDNLQISFTVVDELCDFSPPLWEGPFFRETQYIDVDIPYNVKSEKYRNFTFDTSAVERDKQHAQRHKARDGKDGKDDKEDLIITKKGMHDFKPEEETSWICCRCFKEDEETPSGVRKSETRTTEVSELQQEQQQKLLPDPGADTTKGD